MRRLHTYLPAILTLAILVACWEGYVRVFDVSSFILPAPSRILGAATELGDTLLGHTWTTTYEILVGFSIGTLLGVLIAFVIVHSAFAARILHPLLLASQTVPKLAVAPLLIIWFGTGVLTKIIVIVLVCFFPIAVNVVEGLRATDRNAIDLVRLVTPSRLTIFFKVQFPNSIPYFFAGLKISIAAAVIGAIVAEWVGATSGLGYLILYGGQSMRTDLMFVGVLMTVALGMALYGAVSVAERLLSWRTAK